MIPAQSADSPFLFHPVSHSHLFLFFSVIFFPLEKIRACEFNEILKRKKEIMGQIIILPPSVRANFKKTRTKGR